jgi:hypothetical protein
MSQMPEESSSSWNPSSGKLTVEEWLEMEMFNGIIPIALPFFLMIMGARSLPAAKSVIPWTCSSATRCRRWRLVAASPAHHGHGPGRGSAHHLGADLHRRPPWPVSTLHRQVGGGIAEPVPFCPVLRLAGSALLRIMRRARWPSPCRAWSWWLCMS